MVELRDANHPILAKCTFKTRMCMDSLPPPPSLCLSPLSLPLFACSAWAAVAAVVVVCGGVWVVWWFVVVWCVCVCL